MFGHRTIRVLHPAIGQMGVVVMVAVNGKRLGGRPTKSRIYSGLWLTACGVPRQQT